MREGRRIKNPRSSFDKSLNEGIETQGSNEGRRIRTPVGISQQILSLPRLTTPAFSHRTITRIVFLSLVVCQNEFVNYKKSSMRGQGLEPWSIGFF